MTGILAAGLEAVLQRGIDARLPANGTSMLPFLSPGSILTVSPIDPGLQPRKGEIVVREWDGQLLVHRVVRANPLLTKGDATGDFDPFEARLLGRVTAVERGGRIIALHPRPFVANVSRFMRPAQAWLARRSRRRTPRTAPGNASEGRSAASYAALAQVAQSFRARDIDLIVLKGAATAAMLYRNPEQRPFGDVDLLVRAQDFDRAYEALCGLGFAEASNRKGGQQDFVRDGVFVELHCDLINNPRLRGAIRVDPDHIWSSSVPARLMGIDVRVLGTEHTLLHQCVHLAGHYLYSPLTLQDMRAVIAGRRVDWHGLCAIAKASGATTIVYAGLSLARSQGSSHAPAFVLEKLAPRNCGRLIARMVAFLSRRDRLISRPAFLLLLDTPKDILRALAVTFLPGVMEKEG